MEYLYCKDIIAIHDLIISVQGGEVGILNKNYLISCLEFLQDDDYYPSFTSKLTHLMYSIAKNHAFIDGNKRTAIATGAMFIAINNVQFDIHIYYQIFYENFENIILDVVINKISKKEFEKTIDNFLRTNNLLIK